MNKLLNFVLILLAMVGFALTLTLTFAYDRFFRFAATDLASDGRIENSNAVVQTIYLFLCAVGIALFLLKGAWVYTEKKFSISGLPFHVKLFYTLLVLMLLNTFFLKSVYVYYKEDGILENLTVLMAFSGSFILLYVAWLHKFTIRGLFLLALAAMLLMFAMEEISWGQRIFGWKTSPLMQKINEQQENNFHNLLNGYFDIGYVLVSGLLASLFFFREQWIWIFNKFSRIKELADFIPSKHFYYTGYFYLFLMMFTLVFDRGGETLEAAIALMFLFYAVDVVKKFEPETALTRKMVR